MLKASTLTAMSLLLKSNVRQASGLTTGRRYNPFIMFLGFLASRRQKSMIERISPLSTNTVRSNEAPIISGLVISQLRRKRRKHNQHFDADRK